MSPEQARGGPLDIRSDLFCLALVLYETIVGRPLRQHHTGSITGVLQALDVSIALRAVLHRALEDSPERRYASPQEMHVALLETPEGEASKTLSDSDLLLARSAQPAGRRLAVLPAVSVDAVADPAEPLET
jgi:serine/threonine-protein kinase